MTRTIQPVRVPRNVVSDLPPPITSVISEIPQTVVGDVKPPVVRGIRPPVVDVPGVVIDYPIIDLDTEQQFQGQMDNSEPSTDTSVPETRDLPATPPPVPEIPQAVIDIGGIDIPMPDPGPLVAAGSLAVVTTVVTLGATIGVNQAKTALEPLLKKALASAGKKKKIKVKKVTPVLHYIPNEGGTSDCIEYTAKGMKVLESGIEKLEQHLRDQVEIDALWEFDNKVIIDEELSKQLTKEGRKRFKKYFVAPKVIAKKLGSKFAF